MPLRARPAHLCSILAVSLTGCVPSRSTPRATRQAVPDTIVFVQDGSGPPPFHVADAERLKSALAPCALPDLSATRLTTVALGPFPATLRLPGADAATTAEVPDSTWQGWDWPGGGSLVFFVYRQRGLPGLYALEGNPPGACRITVDGHPMDVWRRTEPTRRGTLHRVDVGGFLDDTTMFWAGAYAGSAEGVDSLLAALQTLTPR